ncbi:MAG: dTMP kinase [bacterium]
MAKGIFITFEGIEGCGKTTQVDLLKNYLVQIGHEVVITREPGGCLIGEKIRDILLDPGNRGMTAHTELLLYEASRAQHVADIILPALKEGKTVISDRFYDASTAYQGHARGLGADKVEELNLFATGGLRPDLTIVLDLPASEGLRRLGRNLDRIESEAVDFHEKVRNGYIEIAGSDPGRVKLVDSSGPVESTAAEIKRIVDEFLPRRRRG